MTAPPVATVRDIRLLWPDSTRAATSTIIPGSSRAAQGLLPRSSTADLGGVTAGNVHAGRWCSSRDAVLAGAAHGSRGAVGDVTPSPTCYAAVGHCERRTEPRSCLNHPWGPVEADWSRRSTSSSSARKSILAGVDIGWRCGYDFCRSRDQERPGRDELPGSSTQLQLAGRCGGGVPKPERLQDGDGTDDRAGWPAVIRGRHEQYRSGSTSK